MGDIIELFDCTEQDEPTMKEAIFAMADQMVNMQRAMESMRDTMEDQHAVISGLILRQKETK